MILTGRPGCPVCNNINPSSCYLCRGAYLVSALQHLDQRDTELAIVLDAAQLERAR